jgi:hypothetical protein
MTEQEQANLEEINFEGTPIKIGKKSFILPPLPVTRLKKLNFYGLQKEFNEARKVEDVEKIGELSEKFLLLIFDALKMNYPNITQAESTDLIYSKQLYDMVSYLIDTKENLDSVKNV